MKRQKLLIILMWLALLFLGAGCASFSQDRLPPVTDLPQKFRGNTSVGIQVNWTVKVIQEYMTTQNQFLLPALEARKIFVKVFRESGWFAGVEAGGGSDPDIQVDIHMLNYGEVYPMQTLIAGLTLCLWPTWAADHYRMEATVTVGEAVSG